MLEEKKCQRNKNVFLKQDMEEIKFSMKKVILVTYITFCQD